MRLLLLALLALPLASYAQEPPHAAYPAGDGYATSAGEIAPYAATHEVPRDTSQASLRYHEAQVEKARLTLREASGWRRLVPTVRFNARAGASNYAFLPADAGGFQTDPALQRWPRDTWSLSAGWQLDDLLLARTARRRAAADLTAATAQLDAARARHVTVVRTDSLRAASHHAQTVRRAERLAAQHALLEQEHAVEDDLLRLARLRYDRGEVDFEALATRRLAALRAERRLLTATHDLTDTCHQIQSTSDACPAP